MFERYTETARCVVTAAREHAGRTGCSSIETEHLLWSLVRQNETLFVRLLGSTSSVQRLSAELEGLCPAMDTNSKPAWTPECLRVLAYAAQEAARLNESLVSIEHLLLGLLREENSAAASVLSRYGLRVDVVRETVTVLAARSSSASEPNLSVLSEFTRDLTEAARKGELMPLIGREREIKRLIQILCRRTKNSPVLIGDQGVGKTAIVEGLAQRIVDRAVPAQLLRKKILALDLSLLVAGTRWRGQFEERLKGLLRAISESMDGILFIDEIHTVIGAGSAEGSMDAAAILKPALSQGEVQCIGASTTAEFRKTIAKDRPLERRFQPIQVEPPNEEDTIRILFGIREVYQKYHGITYTDQALETAVLASARYLPDRLLPDKAIDVMDEAGVRAKLRGSPMPDGILEAQKRIDATVASIHQSIRARDLSAVRRHCDQESLDRESLRQFYAEMPVETESVQTVTKADVEQVVSEWSGIPVTSINDEESGRLRRLEEELRRRVIGQDRAISALARAVRRSRAGMRWPQRPVGSFIFLGPTGVGKTAAARALALCLFGSDEQIIRFDMSEFMERHSVSKLIGSPPGYVGFEQGGQLTESARRSPYSIILLDEIEKAHPDIHSVLLQILDDGRLTDGLGNTADFTHCIIIMTSNLGGRMLEKPSMLGFSSAVEGAVAGRIEDEVMREVRQAFSPEFLNRIDEVIIFDPLSSEDLARIAHLIVELLNGGLELQGVHLRMTDEAAGHLVRKTLTDRKYGARPLRRALQKYVADPLADALILGTLKTPVDIEIYWHQDALWCRSVSEKHEPAAFFLSVP